MVAKVAGDRAEVVGLMGEGVDPHLYKPTRNDVSQLLDADLIFYSGLHLEGRMTDTFVQIARSGKPVFAVTEQIDEKFLLESADGGGHFDPHVWMDVSAWAECVGFVAKALGEFDSAHASEYVQRATEYQAELKKLDEYARQSIASIPESQRVLVTAHDAFEYFSRAYGIEVRSVQGVSTELAGMSRLAVSCFPTRWDKRGHMKGPTSA
jgi:manganese/zinc/iron transport system substrate-binding protein